MNENITPQKKLKQIKKAQYKEDEIEIKLQMSDQSWNNCKFQIHLNKLEWVNPRIHI